MCRLPNLYASKISQKWQRHVVPEGQAIGNVSKSGNSVSNYRDCSVHITFIALRAG